MEKPGRSVLAIPVRKVPIMILDRNNRRVRGNIFLRFYARTHSGEETILDRLNDETGFVPVEISGEKAVTIMSKAGASAVAVDIRHEKDAVPGRVEEFYGKEEMVQIQLSNGSEVVGALLFMGPRDQFRLSDFMNFTQGGFILVREKERLHFINRAHVIRMTEVGAGRRTRSGRKRRG